MKKILLILGKFLLALSLTLLTQIGGIIYLITEVLFLKKIKDIG